MTKSINFLPYDPESPSDEIVAVFTGATSTEIRKAVGSTLVTILGIPKAQIEFRKVDFRNLSDGEVRIMTGEIPTIARRTIGNTLVSVFTGKPLPKKRKD